MKSWGHVYEQNDRNKWDTEKIAYHPSKHASQAPHVQRIIIVLQIHKKFRALEVSIRDMEERSKGIFNNESKNIPH